MRVDQPRERGLRAREAVGALEQPPVVMKDQDEAVELERELLGFDIAPQLAGFDRLPDRAQQLGVQPSTLYRHIPGGRSSLGQAEKPIQGGIG